MKDIKFKRKVIIKISTDELYQNWVRSNADCIGYAEPDDVNQMIETMAKGMRNLLLPNGREIRKLFNTGFTVMLMGDHMDVIDVDKVTRDKRELEVRIYQLSSIGNEAKLLTILTDDELLF